MANESNSIYILSTNFATVDNYIRISVAQLNIKWQMKVIVYTFCQPILQVLIIASGFLLHNYIEWQMKVIVYTFCQPILQG